MRNLGDMETVFLQFRDDLIRRIGEAEQKVAKEIQEEIKSNSPDKSGTYISSIKVSPTEEKEGVIKTRVYTDLKVGGDDPKWKDVPYAAFLEWGTGPLGEGTNTFDHGYPYTTDAPWNFFAELQYQETGTWGMAARPHFYPALVKHKETFKQEVRKAMKKK